MASATPSSERLLAIIELQNAIAAAQLGAEDVMKLVAERAALLCGAGTASVELAEGDDMVCKAAIGAQPGQRRARKQSLPDRAIGERKPLRAEDGSQVSAPLVHGEHAVGVLTIGGPKAAGGFTAEDVETLRILAGIIAIPLHRTRSFPRPRIDTTHDALTGLQNRKAFEERVLVELERNRRYDQAFSLALLDLDGFNTAIDRAGEAAGDALLKEIGTMLSKHTRVMDACFRLGGDEFAIVMPGTALDGARIVTERCREHIEAAKLAEGTVTPSVGIVEATDEKTVEAIMVKAESALKADKVSRSSAS
jgi:diguanylate cyclase (GGDEF)-like protein